MTILQLVVKDYLGFVGQHGLRRGWPTVDPAVATLMLASNQGLRWRWQTDKMEGPEAGVERDAVIRPAASCGYSTIKGRHGSQDMSEQSTEEQCMTAIQRPVYLPVRSSVCLSVCRSVSLFVCQTRHAGQRERGRRKPHRLVRQRQPPCQRFKRRLGRRATG
ncbi:hypothetical protein BD289DRAFT_46206 [Coniella lustricola]|uniref:Uncharacterized protein n=1 Tax=Coniella lustricola TaxID=2025994 RepID=A0A2T3AIB9_9PEZI|nr:hypothetical protein BD289DRAFT_46206 [Coniella lustricola]